MKIKLANGRHGLLVNLLDSCRERVRRLEFKLSIGLVHPGGLMLGWLMGQMIL